MKDKSAVKSKEYVLAYQREYYQRNKEKIKSRVKEWQAENADAHNETVAKYYQQNKEVSYQAANKYKQTHQRTTPWVQKTLLRHSKARALKKGLEHNLTIDYIRSIWPVDNKCPVLGTEFVSSTDNMMVCASLDRIDNTKGYIEGNVAVISWRANSLKSNASIADIEAIIRYIEENTK